FKAKGVQIVDVAVQMKTHLPYLPFPSTNEMPRCRRRLVEIPRSSTAISQMRDGISGASLGGGVRREEAGRDSPQDPAPLEDETPFCISPANTPPFHGETARACDPRRRRGGVRACAPPRRRGRMRAVCRFASTLRCVLLCPCPRQDYQVEQSKQRWMAIMVRKGKEGPADMHQSERRAMRLVSAYTCSHQHSAQHRLAMQDSNARRQQHEAWRRRILAELFLALDLDEDDLGAAKASQLQRETRGRRLGGVAQRPGGATWLPGCTATQGGGSAVRRRFAGAET
ncbi:hypothetical protein EJB05_46868, partial [Eragrostis curvula]